MRSVHSVCEVFVPQTNGSTVHVSRVSWEGFTAAFTMSLPRAQLVTCLLLLATVLGMLPCGSAYTLLFYPLSERTHMMVHLKLASELALRNNTVYFMTAQCHHGFAQRTARQMAPSASLRFIPYDAECEQWEVDKKGYQLVNPVSAAKGILANVFGRVDAVLSNATLMDELQQLAPEVDLMVNDILSYGMLLASKFNLQFVDIDVGTAGAMWESVFHGAEPSTSFIPAPGTFFPTDGMNYWQRCVNLLVTKVLRGFVSYTYWNPNAWLQTIIKKHDLPLRWPYVHYMMMLVNSNFITEPPRAIAPNTKYIGPILPEPAQQLPAGLASWVQGSGPLGTVFVSFGGTLEAPLAASRTLIQVMHALPNVRFVWKLRPEDQREIKGELEGLENALVREWVPQNDLLGHAKVRAFVTQGGYLSIAEAAYHAVPILGMPFIPGQGELIRYAQDQGRAKLIPANTLMKGDVQGFKHALMDVLTNSTYHEAAAVTSRRLRATARPYKQVAADWVEYAAAVKDHGPFLHPHKVHQYWYQQVMLDVVLLYAAMVAVPLWLLLSWVDRVRWGFVSNVPSAAVFAEIVLRPAGDAKKTA